MSPYNYNFETFHTYFAAAAIAAAFDVFAAVVIAAAAPAVAVVFVVVAAAGVAVLSRAAAVIGDAAGVVVVAAIIAADVAAAPLAFDAVLSLLLLLCLRRIDCGVLVRTCLYSAEHGRVLSVGGVCHHSPEPLDLLALEEEPAMQGRTTGRCGWIWM